MSKPSATILAASLVLAVAGTTGRALAQDAGDPVAGEVVFQKCAMCHELGPTAKNMTGPVLNGLIGRRSGTYADFNYTPQNRNIRVTWDIPNLSRYLKAPKSFIPGTKMFFDGLATPKEIADVIAYIGQYDDKGNKKP